MKYYLLAIRDTVSHIRRLLHGNRPVSRGHHLFTVAVAIWILFSPLVGVAQAPTSSQKDCYGDYERVVAAAWIEYDECVQTFNWNNTSLSTWQVVSGKMSCRISWVAKAESAMFQLIACSTIPIK